MSRKFVGKLIRIMMTKSSSCDILKKKRTIRRGSGSRPKGSYLMDLRFWNYVIPDGSTTLLAAGLLAAAFWNYVIPDGSTTHANMHRRWRSFGTMSFQMVLLLNGKGIFLICCFGTMSFQMVLLLPVLVKRRWLCFGTMSFQMVLLLRICSHCRNTSFGTMSFQMVLLPFRHFSCAPSRFGTMSFQMVLLLPTSGYVCSSVLELCHSRWFYYLPVDFHLLRRRFGTMSFQMVLLLARPH